MPASRMLLLALVSVLAAPAASGESSLLLPYPGIFGTVPASTWNENHRVGGAHLVVEMLDDGNVRMISESGIDKGARTVATAVLEPVETEAGRFLRPLTQDSRSFDPTGLALGVLAIDHRAARGTCTPPEGQGEAKIVELPAGDRVVNVPLNLLFEPLVRGQVDEVAFQLMMCRFGARLIDMQASVAERNGSNGSSDLVEVRYKPDFGGFVNMVGNSVIPQLSFWFDPRSSNPWVAHKIPLYSRGPEVLVIRDGVPTESLD